MLRACPGAAVRNCHTAELCPLTTQEARLKSRCRQGLALSGGVAGVLPPPAPGGHLEPGLQRAEALEPCAVRELLSQRPQEPVIVLGHTCHPEASFDRKTIRKWKGKNAVCPSLTSGPGDPPPGAATIRGPHTFALLWGLEKCVLQRGEEGVFIPLGPLLAPPSCKRREERPHLGCPSFPASVSALPCLQPMPSSVSSQASGSLRADLLLPTCLLPCGHCPRHVWLPTFRACLISPLWALVSPSLNKGCSQL